MKCDLSGFHTLCLIVNRLSVLNFVMLQSPRAEQPSGYSRIAMRDRITIDAHMTCARSDLAL